LVAASVILEIMTLLDAKEYDPTGERKRRTRIITAIVLLVILAFLGWWFRYWPEERVASQFFDALQKQQYETAYGIWMHDPQWRQHPDRYQKYPYNEFYQDWGPGGEWGLIKSYRVYAAGSPPGGGSGVIVDVTVNDRAQRARVWVEKSDKTMSFSPY
jgi:hypothetical protein